MSKVRLLLTLGIVLGLTGAQATVLHAQPAITDSNYRIELHQGPVLGSTRVIGLSGAYVAVAEGAVGLPFNPAAVAPTGRTTAGAGSTGICPSTT